MEDTQAEVARNNQEFLTGGAQLQETEALAQVFDDLTLLVDTGGGLDLAKLHNIARSDAGQAAFGNIAHVLHGADSTVKSQYEAALQAQSDSSLEITSSDAVSDGRPIESLKIGRFEAGLEAPIAESQESAEAASNAAIQATATTLPSFADLATNGVSPAYSADEMIVLRSEEFPIPAEAGGAGGAAQATEPTGPEQAREDPALRPSNAGADDRSAGEITWGGEIGLSLNEPLDDAPAKPEKPSVGEDEAEFTWGTEIGLGLNEDLDDRASAGTSLLDVAEASADAAGDFEPVASWGADLPIEDHDVAVELNVEAALPWGAEIGLSLNDGGAELAADLPGLGDIDAALTLDDEIALDLAAGLPIGGGIDIGLALGEAGVISADIPLLGGLLGEEDELDFGLVSQLGIMGGNAHSQTVPDDNVPAMPPALPQFALSIEDEADLAVLSQIGAVGTAAIDIALDLVGVPQQPVSHPLLDTLDFLTPGGALLAADEPEQPGLIDGVLSGGVLDNLPGEPGQNAPAPSQAEPNAAQELAELPVEEVLDGVAGMTGLPEALSGLLSTPSSAGNENIAPVALAPAPSGGSASDVVAEIVSGQHDLFLFDAGQTGATTGQGWTQVEGTMQGLGGSLPGLTDWIQASDDPVQTSAPENPAPGQSQNPLSLPIVSSILNQDDDDLHRGGLLGGLFGR